MRWAGWLVALTACSGQVEVLREEHDADVTVAFDAARGDGAAAAESGGWPDGSDGGPEGGALDAREAGCTIVALSCRGCEAVASELDTPDAFRCLPADGGCCDTSNGPAVYRCQLCP